MPNTLVNELSSGLPAQADIEPVEAIDDTELETWFEHDRAHVALIHRDTGAVIVEWWDEEFWEAIEDGLLDYTAFLCGRLLDAHRLHVSAFEYAEQIGLL